MNSPILAPAVALILWSLFMLVLVALTRFSALGKLNLSLGSAVGSRGQDLEGVVPDKVQWKSHNYTHLMEQPTLFYAVVLILAILGDGAGLNLQLAWAYVILRVLHSIVQVTFNRVVVRFTLFSLATFALLALALHAAMIVF